MKCDQIIFYLNGVRREIDGRHSFMMLAEWLRKEADLTGTKIVCAEGDCGACTVLRAFPEPGLELAQEAILFEAMNSCITMLAQLHGASLVTVEGVQDGQSLSPVQIAMKDCHGSQCGYCTPGFVMALSGMFERYDSVDAKTAANYLTGNLCRCTGYQPIIDASVRARADQRFSIARRYLTANSVEELALVQKKSVAIKDGDREFFAPVSLREALTITATRSNYRIVGAATDIGVQTNKGRPLANTLLSLHLIPELYRVDCRRGKMTRKVTGKVTIGARVTLSKLRRELTDICPEFASFLNLFASPQIKNVATLVGNLANASPIGDTLPFLLVADAEIHLASRPGGKGAIVKRTVPIGDFFRGYKQLAMEPGEIITHVSFVPPVKDQLLRLYKVSQRKDLDISAVSGAFSVKVASGKISTIKLAYGGVAPTPIRLLDVERELTGRRFDQSLIDQTADLIARTLEPLSDARGTATYRRVLAANMFRRFGSEVLGGG